MYSFLNYFFFVFHTIIVLFILIGWAFRKTRKIHLLVIGVIAFSWFILGIWYGWGFCFCTEWHWQVRRLLGYCDYSTSYIHLLLLNLTGKNFPNELVDKITFAVFFECIALSLILNLRDRKSSKSKVESLK